MAVIDRLRSRYRFHFKRGGYQVKIPHTMISGLFDLTPPALIIASRGVKTGKYRLGIGMYGDVKPELKAWLRAHGPYNIEPYQRGKDVKAVAASLLEQLQYAAPAQAIRFAHDEDAALFKITWL